MIVDASVAVKWLIAETGSDAADELLAAGGLGVPDLLFTEDMSLVTADRRFLAACAGTSYESRIIALDQPQSGPAM